MNSINVDGQTITWVDELNNHNSDLYKSVEEAFSQQVGNTTSFIGKI